MTAVLPEQQTMLVSFAATADQAELAAAIKFVSAALPARSAVPVLGGVLLEADSHGIYAAGTDFDLSTRVRVNGFGDGRVLVEASLLKGMLAKLPKGDVTLAIIDGKLELRSGQRTYKLRLLDLDDYPQPPVLAPTAAVFFPKDFAMLSKVAVAATKDATLPILGNIKFEIADGEVAAAATDRYRMAALQVQAVTAFNTEVLVPATAVAFAVKHLTGEVTMGVHEGLASFTAGGRQVLVRVGTGDFPQWRKLLPLEQPWKLLIAAKTLLAGVDGASAVLNRNAKIYLTTDITGLTVSASNYDGAEYSEFVGGAYEGEPFTTAVNPAYFTEGIKQLGDQVQISWDAASKPMLLSNPDDPSYTYLVMPIRVSG